MVYNFLSPPSHLFFSSFIIYFKFILNFLKITFSSELPYCEPCHAIITKAERCSKCEGMKQKKRGEEEEERKRGAEEGRGKEEWGLRLSSYTLAEVLVGECIKTESATYHKKCFSCQLCSKGLTKEDGQTKFGKPYCKACAPRV